MLKVWTYIKKYWWYILIVVIFILCVIFLRKNTVFENLLQYAKDGFEKQLKLIEELDKQKEEKKEQLQQQYDQIIVLIQKKYEEEQKELAENEKKRVLEFVKNNSTEELAKKLAETYGIEYKGGNSV